MHSSHIRPFLCCSTWWWGVVFSSFFFLCLYRLYKSIYFSIFSFPFSRLLFYLRRYWTHHTSMYFKERKITVWVSHVARKVALVKVTAISRMSYLFFFLVSKLFALLDSTAGAHKTYDACGREEKGKCMK